MIWFAVYGLGYVASFISLTRDVFRDAINAKRKLLVDENFYSDPTHLHKQYRGQLWVLILLPPFASVFWPILVFLFLLDRIAKVVGGALDKMVTASIDKESDQ